MKIHPVFIWDLQLAKNTVPLGGKGLLGIYYGKLVLCPYQLMPFEGIEIGTCRPQKTERAYFLFDVSVRFFEKILWIFLRFF